MTVKTHRTPIGKPPLTINQRVDKIRAAQRKVGAKTRIVRATLKSKQTLTQTKRL